MKQNKFTILGIFAVLLLTLGLVSATTSSVMSIDNLITPTSVAENAGSFTFTFNITYTGASSDANISFADSIVSTFGTLVIPNAENMDGVASETKTITGTVSNFADKGGQDLIVTINATKDSARDDETNFTVSITDVTTDVYGCMDSSANNYDSSATVDDGSCTYDDPNYNFCEINGNVGDLEIADFVINNLGRGEDEEWELLDEVEIEVEIENTHNTDDVDDVLVEIKIMHNGEDVTSDFDLDNEEVDLGRIKDDESEIAIFTIDEVPADLDEGDYKLYIKAYSENDEDTQCIAESNDMDKDTYQEIKINREHDPAVVVKEDILKVSASCGDENVMLALNVYNLGSDKEEKVLVTLSNSLLGIDEKIVIDDLKSGKRKEVTFFFDVPADLTKEIYDLEVMTYFDYDDDEDEMDLLAYDEDSDEIDEDYSVRLEVLSCQGPSPTINVALESEMTLGEELVVKARITNNGAENDFAFTIVNYESWAELVSVSTQSTSINKGEFEEITVTLIPKEEGVHSFNINTISDGETYTQPVSVNVAGSPTIIEGISDPIFYIIIAIVVVLVLILLTLIIRVASRGSKSSAY